MLSKRVCNACYKSAYPSVKRRLEKEWHQTEMSCPSEFMNDNKHIIYVEDPPPEWCPMKLEHLIATHKTA